MLQNPPGHRPSNVVPPGVSNNTRVNGVAELQFDNPVPGTHSALPCAKSAELMPFCL